MKIAALTILTFFCANSLFAQNMEAFLSVDSRAGYSTNTFLHPFIGEWDQADRGAFTRISPSVEIFASRGRFSTEFSGGYLYEPTFDDRQNWTGLYASSRSSYRLKNQFSLEIQVAANRISSVYERSSLSILPALSWAPSLFTNVRARAGSSFREYNGLQIDENGNPQTFSDRFDVYGLELERWPSLKWQLRGSVYGLMDQNVVENHSIALAVSRIIRQSSAVTLNVSLNRYQNSFSVEGDGGTPTVPGPPAGNDTRIVEDTDRLFRSGLSFSFPIIGDLSANGSVSHLLFIPGSAESRSDVELSLGVSYRFSVPDLFKNRRNELSADWERRNNESVVVKVKYRGGGELYIVGEFNDWERPGIPLYRQGEGSSRYAAQLDLEHGIYEYKVLHIDNGEETWIEFSDDTMTVSDGFGGDNGLLYID